MTLEIYFNQSRHHPKSYDYFDFDQLDAFHDESVLSAIYGNNWYSVLLIEKNNAFLHTFSKQKIEGTDWFDIEPFLGYSGPVINTNDPEFLLTALRNYGYLCQQEKIIAEIIRFNPLLENHKLFINNEKVSVFKSKEIVLVKCKSDERYQLQEFSSSCQQTVRTFGNKQERQTYNFEILKNSQNMMNKFIDFYHKSLDRVTSEKKWYFSLDFFDRITRSDKFEIEAIIHNGQFVSASVVIKHPLAGYYLLAANDEKLVSGSNDFLIFKIAQEIRKHGIKYLILGGGNSSRDDDPLLRFKKKFSSNNTYGFYMGKIVHNQEIFTQLCQDALSKSPELANSNFFLKYRLLTS